MSRFPEQPEQPRQPDIVGTVINGVFECDCGEVVTAAIHSRKDQKLYWTCPEGHDCSIYFKL
jgi:hypothetical protein